MRCRICKKRRYIYRSVSPETSSHRLASCPTVSLLPTRAFANFFFVLLLMIGFSLWSTPQRIMNLQAGIAKVLRTISRSS